MLYSIKAAADAVYYNSICWCCILPQQQLLMLYNTKTASADAEYLHNNSCCYFLLPQQQQSKLHYCHTISCRCCIPYHNSSSSALFIQMFISSWTTSDVLSFVTNLEFRVNKLWQCHFKDKFSVQNGMVVGFFDAFQSGRKYALDMAGKKDINFSLFILFHIRNILLFLCGSTL